MSARTRGVTRDDASSSIARPKAQCAVLFRLPRSLKNSGRFSRRRLVFDKYSNAFTQAMEPVQAVELRLFSMIMVRAAQASLSEPAANPLLPALTEDMPPVPFPPVPPDHPDLASPRSARATPACPRLPWSS